ncbi:Rv3654c family TadE-like protein [Luedemannella flava]
MSSVRRLPRGRADRGGAGVLVLAFGLVVVLFGAACALVGAAVVARHRAQAAADLGALAGAAWAPVGESAACGRAAALVAANGADLVSCVLVGLDVIVTAAVTLDLPGPALGTATRSARAGPATAESA